MANIQSCFKRYEKKYCLTLAQQQAILQEMQPYMKKDAYGQYTICNLYYDTDDWRLIRTSLEKPLYKEKLRVRSYGTPRAGRQCVCGDQEKVRRCGLQAAHHRSGG